MFSAISTTPGGLRNGFRRLRRVTGLLIALAGISSPVLAQHDSDLTAPPVDTLVARALARSPDIAAMQARVSAARELVRSSGALPNPMLEVMLQNIGTSWTVGKEEMSMIGPTITQPIPFPGKRGARRNAARAEATVQAASLEETRRTVARDIRTLYARIYAIDHEEHCLLDGLQLVDVLRTAANQRYSAGLSNQESVIKSQLSESRVRERLTDLEAERQGLVAALNRLLDQPGDVPLPEITTLPAPDQPPADWQSAVYDSSAEVATKRAALAAAERKLAAERVESRPDLSLKAGVGFRGPFDPAITLGVGMELPIFNGSNRGPVVAAAQYEVEAARQDLRLAEATARTDAARMVADYAKAQAQVTRYEQALVPQTSLALDAARSGYISGSGDFSTVIEDFNMWLDARAELARREAERYIAWAELESLIHSPVGTTAGKD